MSIHVYLDINPITKLPFYVGIGNTARVQTIVRNRIHTELVFTFPEQKFKRIIIYKNISIEKAYRIEGQIIKKCGKLIDGSGYLSNILDSGTENNFLSMGQYRRGKKFPEASKRQLGKTMPERLNDPTWVDPRKGKSFSEIYKAGYIHPRIGKKLKEVKGPLYVEPKSKPFKLIINGIANIFASENDFIEKTKLSSPMLCKLKRNGHHIIKRQSNSIHSFNSGDKIEYFSITIDEYLREVM